MGGRPCILFKGIFQPLGIAPVFFVGRPAPGFRVSKAVYQGLFLLFFLSLMAPNLYIVLLPRWQAPARAKGVYLYHPNLVCLRKSQCLADLCLAMRLGHDLAIQAQFFTRNKLGCRASGFEKTGIPQPFIQTQSAIRKGIFIFCLQPPRP